MYVNAFLFGIMCTLFVEMAIYIIACLIHNVTRRTRKNKNHRVYKEDK